jgi:hypothetical protein
VLLALALLLASSDPARPTALLPLRGLGVSADVVGALELTLRNEVAQLPEAKLVPQKDLEAHLAPGCSEKPHCAAGAAARSGARQLIVGTVSQLGDSYMIDLKLLDARSAQEQRRATHPVSGSPDALIETLRGAAVELLAPARFVGGLQIDVADAPGAAVFIDGKQVGVAPIKAPIQGLVPGQHTLRVVDKGRELSTFVEVRYGVVNRARVELGPVRIQKSALPEVESGAQAARAKPSWVRPAAGTALGLALVSAGVGAVLQARSSSGGTALEQGGSQTALIMPTGSLSSQGSHGTNLAPGFFAASAVLAVTGGALLYWDLR